MKSELRMRGTLTLHNHCPTILSTYYKRGDSAPLVLVTQKSTNTQLKSTKGSSNMTIMETQPKSTQQSSQTSTSSLEDSLAKLSVWLENVGDWKIREEHFSMTLHEYLKLNNLDTSCLRMLKDCSVHELH